MTEYGGGSISFRVFLQIVNNEKYIKAELTYIFYLCDIKFKLFSFSENRRCLLRRPLKLLRRFLSINPSSLPEELGELLM